MSPLIMYMTSSLGSLWNSLRNSRPRATKAMESGACQSTVFGRPELRIEVMTCPRSTAFISSMTSSLDQEQLRGVAAENRDLVVVAQSRRLENQAHLGLRPRIRKVGADDELTRTDLGGQVAHALAVEDHRV